MSDGKNKKIKNGYKINLLQEALQYLKGKPGSNEPKIWDEYLKAKDSLFHKSAFH